MYKATIQRFDRARVLVIGDVMLDKYIFGNVNRISPEAPIPVVSVTRERFVPGGAANVANNIVALGGKVSLIGVVGDDECKDVFLDEMKKIGIDFRPIVNPDVSTIQKVRIISQKQQLMRIDYETVLDDYEQYKYENDDKLCAIAKELIPKSDIVIVSDYAKGTITKKVIDKIKIYCKEYGKKIISDPKPNHKELYKGVFLITPNQKESEGLSGIRLSSEDNVLAAGKKIMEELGCNVLIKQGENGMSLFENNGNADCVHIPAEAKEIYDVSGAGDTVIATLALCLACDATLVESAKIANQAAGIVVGKFGTATTTKEELLDVFEQENKKIKKIPELMKIVEDLKAKNRRVVFTNGCFDILHKGHVDLLKKARSLGDLLIVGLNTDASIKRIKGPKRPIIPEEERVEILAALESVSYVVMFEEDDPCSIISKIKPDIHVKGGDYDSDDYKQMPESKVVHSYGGEVKIIKFVDDKSTTNIIKRIMDTN